MKHVVALLSSEQNLLAVLQTSIEDPFQIKLAESVDQILGLETGSLFAEIAILSEADFSFERALSTIDLLLGAGIPVFVYSRSQKSDFIWACASMGALPLRLDTMKEDFGAALARRKYDYETLELENEFASHYDEKELSSAATLSAIIWENEYVLKQIRTYLEGKNSSFRILDLGCGTGRFEEILLSDPFLSHKIESIHAIDFAPMYLKKAKERLSYFFSEEELNKISFQRRIAEDTRLPSNYYDIVIASFGVICFSQFHRTIPEIQRVLKPKGLAILNGYNRNSISYEFNELAKTKGVESLFTAAIDREKNEMMLNGKTMKCFTFHIDELQSFLWFVGLKPLAESIQTFPTLYGCTRKDYLKLFEEAASLGPTTKSCLNYPSYQSKNLELDCFKSGFSPILHKLDADLTHVLKDRGFYFSLTATK